MVVDEVKTCYLGVVSNQGRRSETLVRSGLCKGEWYYSDGETTRGLGNSIRLWIPQAVPFRVFCDEQWKEVRALQGGGMGPEGYQEVVVSLALVSLPGGTLLPVRYEMRMAQCSVFRAADSELSDVTLRAPQWSRKSPGHQIAAQAALPWWRFCVQATTEEKTSRTARQYQSVRASCAPTPEGDLAELERAWSDPTWREQYAATEQSVFSRISFLFSLCNRWE